MCPMTHHGVCKFIWFLIVKSVVLVLKVVLQQNVCLPKSYVFLFSSILINEGGDSELETVIWLSWLAGIIVGSMVGAEKVMQKRFRSGPRNVIITGR